MSQNRKALGLRALFLRVSSLPCVCALNVIMAVSYKILLNGSRIVVEPLPASVRQVVYAIVATGVFIAVEAKRSVAAAVTETTRLGTQSAE